MTDILPTYEFWCASSRMNPGAIPYEVILGADSERVASVRLDLPPTIGETFTIVGTHDANCVPGTYRVENSLMRCVGVNHRESSVRKVIVRRICRGEPANYRHDMMDQMTVWERSPL